MDESSRPRRRLKASELAPGAERPRAAPPPSRAGTTDAAGTVGSADAMAGRLVPCSDGSDGDFDWAGYWDDLYSDPRYWSTVLPDRPTVPLPVARRTAANGSVMAAVALGMRNVFDPQRDKGEIIVERDDSGDPDNPHKPLHLDFDPESPRRTRATVRPWARRAGPSAD